MAEDKAADARDNAHPKMPSTVVPSVISHSGPTAPVVKVTECPSTSPKQEEGTDSVEVVVMEREQEGNDNSGDEEGIGEDEVEEDGALAETAEADCLVGLNIDDVVVCAQPLPILTEGEEEARVLAEEQRLDDSLSEVRSKAVKLEDGYMIDKHGVIVQVKVVAPSREVKRLCVPVNRRRDLLEVAHKGLVGGHFSHNKMSECLLLNYIWPGLRTEVRKYCAAYPDCQRAGRVLPPKFPMKKPQLFQHLTRD